MYEVVGDDAEVTNSELVKFNKTDGSFSVIGLTGQAPEYVSSATIDVSTDRMFWAVSTKEKEGYLCEVNLSTGAATRLFNFPGNAEVTGMFVKSAKSTAALPMQAQDFSVTFTDGALSGNAKFTIPATLTDGTQAKGNVNYTITAGGQTIATGEAAYGTEVNVPVTLTATGMIEFTVTLANENGASEPAKVSCFVGTGVPAAPAAVKASWTDGKVTLSWDAVTESADGGYINPENVTYSVKYGEITLMENLTDTHAEFNLAMPDELTRYEYAVTAVYAGKESVGALSNPLYLGVATPPYTAAINSEGDLAAFTAIDANGDGKKWEYYRNAAYVISNNQLAADDWLISVPVRLEQGYVYDISTDVYGTIFTDERFELKIGTAPAADAMTVSLVEPTDLIKVGTAKTFTASFAPEATGNYYIGVHAISKPLQFALYTKGIAVSAGKVAAKPGAGTIVAVPDANGDYKITLNLTAPALDLSDKPLDSILRSELYRDDELIKTFDAPAPGSTWQYVDRVAAGPHTYRFVSFSAGGEGTSVSVTGFSGTDKPAKVTGIKVAEPQKAGLVTATWDAVATDHNGNALNPDKVTYSLYLLDDEGQIGKTLIENSKETSFTWQECGENDKQRFIRLIVAADTEGGNSVSSAELTPVGTPYQGMEESFADASVSHIIGANTFGTKGIWLLADDNAFLFEKAYDDDNGFLYFKSDRIGDKAEFITGKISLDGMKNPTVKFYTMPFTNDENLLEVKVREIGSEYRTLLSAPMSQFGDGSTGWVPVQVSLGDFAGKVIQVAVFVEAVSHQFSFVDKFAVEPLVEHDLRLRAITAPKAVKGGYEFPLNIVVENKGTAASGACSVEVYADGKLITSQAQEKAIEPEKEAIVTVPVIMDRFAKTVSYSAKVVYAADEVPANDHSDVVTVKRVDPEYPAVTDLKGQYNADANILQWNAPGLDMPDRFESEDFENADAWVQAYGDWIFVDRDNSVAGGISGSTIPGVRPGKSLLSFFVFDYSDGDWGETFAPSSGNKFLASLYSLESPTIDDWVISPELTGEAQTITFMAKRYHEKYPETFEVYYSTGSTNPDDFVLIEGSRVAEVPLQWTYYEIALPAGAERFAVRSCGENSMLLMLDDFEFMRGAVTKGLVINGYDIYRDGVKLNDAPVAETTWTDSQRSAETHNYTVIPVYNRGEGQAADVKVDQSSGLPDELECGISVTVANRNIVVTGASGETIAVTNVAGQTVATAIGTDTTVIASPAGVMLVKVGAKVFKVMIP